MGESLFDMLYIFILLLFNMLYASEGYEFPLFFIGAS